VISLIRFTLYVAVLAGASAATGNELHPFMRGSWEEISTANAGKAMVVHLWGLSCAPCRIEMPNWGKLVAERPGLNLVLINADFVPNEGRAVAAMLSASGLAGVENWTFADGFVERLRFEIDPAWHGELPLTILIGRDGTRTLMDGIADLERVRAWLENQNAQ
jgi:thiol-disulfide isomerase/thioredoxin